MSNAGNRNLPFILFINWCLSYLNLIFSRKKSQYVFGVSSQMRDFFFKIFAILVGLFPVITLGGIVGGVFAKENYPFYVCVRNAHFICGGTLITPNAVVTAAHCIYNNSRARWAYNHELKVWDGDFTKPDWHVSSRKYSCSHYKVHPWYKPVFEEEESVSPYDVAVIILEKKFNLVAGIKETLKPCPPVEMSPEMYEMGTVIGLGLISQNPDQMAKTLMEATLQRDLHCGKHRQVGAIIDHWNQVCYSLPGKAGACNGDSGGPIVYKKDGKAQCLIGISSYGSDFCDDAEFPGVFTQAAFFNDWIASQI